MTEAMPTSPHLRSPLPSLHLPNSSLPNSSRPTSLGALFAHHAAHDAAHDAAHPSHADYPRPCAVQFEGQRYSYAELARRTARMAHVLAADFGVTAGARVAYLGFNHVDQLCLLIALAQRGAILVPLNYRLAPTEWQTLLRQCQPSLLLHDATWADAAQALGEALSLPVAEISTLANGDDKPNDNGKPSDNPCINDNIDVDPSPPSPVTSAAPVLLVYTSGTTGQAKGALHTQSMVMANMQLSAEIQSLSATDMVATVLPLFHVGGLCIQTLPALWAGASVILHPRFDANAFFATLADSRPSLTLHVPATLRALVEHPAWASADLSCLRALWAGSSPIPADLIAAVHQRGVPVCNVYGATETGPVSIALPPSHAFTHVGSCGWPAPGVEAQLRDGPVPELLLRGPNIIQHYWPASAASTATAALTPACDADGWFHTGDLAQRHPDGRYTIIGRAKDMLISGGENIYPAEIENLLQTHPSVADCAVIGLPDPQWGERVVVVVVLIEKLQAESTHFRIFCKQSLLDSWEQTKLDLSQFLSQHLARYKLPREWIQVKELPKTALGKVQKAVLREQLLARAR
jgi:fatty-acyl-CoA synthase